MPVYLKGTHDFQQLEQFDSILIVPCRFCPAASLAISNDEPYFEFFRHMFQTAAYQQYIKAMKAELTNRGVRVDIFKSHLPHQFVVCMWTSRRRKLLMKRAKKVDAIVVLGCEAAVQTILDSVGASSIQVVQGMRTEGIMSILPRFQLPGSITLQLNSITPLVHREQKPERWMHL